MAVRIVDILRTAVGARISARTVCLSPLRTDGAFPSSGSFSMHDRAPTRSWLVVAALVTIVTLAATPLLQAQSGAKVLTPPRPPDTTARAPQVSRPTAPPSAASSAAVPAAPRAVPVVPQSAVLDSVREAVFHSLLDHDRAGFSTLASAFCLGLSTDTFKKASNLADRADPPEAMVRRLYTPRAPARRASTCTFAPNAGARPVPGRALLYSVGAIDMVSPEHAEAAAAYSYDGYSAGGYTFTVERADSGWVVKQWRMEWTAKSGAP
jgi:hypothetical protein